MIDTGDVDPFLGLDVGKGEHHRTAVTPAGKRVFDADAARTMPHAAVPAPPYAASKPPAAATSS
ncbi:hypothetical protein ACWD5W_03780 [Streptomyces sp. NPDC002455]